MDRVWFVIKLTVVISLITYIINTIKEGVFGEEQSDL